MDEQRIVVWKCNDKMKLCSFRKKTDQTASAPIKDVATHAPSSVQISSVFTTIKIGRTCSGFGWHFTTSIDTDRKIEISQFRGPELFGMQKIYWQQHWAIASCSRSGKSQHGNSTRSIRDNLLIKPFIPFHYVMGWPPWSIFQTLSKLEKNVYRSSRPRSMSNTYLRVALEYTLKMTPQQSIESTH